MSFPQRRESSFFNQRYSLGSKSFPSMALAAAVAGLAK
jgi:hypothetical protein